MRDALPLLVLAGLLLSLWCSVRLRTRQRRRCRHTRYRGAADVVCLPCHQERQRIAGHVQNATGGRQ